MIRRLLATLTVAAAALAIAVAIASCASKHEEPGTATPTAVPGSSTSTSSPGSGSPAAASAYIMFHDDTGALVARDFATGKSSRQTFDANTEVITLMRCSQDASRIAYLKQFFADATHRQIVIRGSNAPAQPLTVPASVQWIAWSPDGNKMALVVWDGKAKQATVAILDVNTGQMSTIMQRNQYVGDISWSSLGDRLTFYLEDTSSTSSEIYVMDATGANQVQLTHGNGDVTWPDPAWSPDGSSILAAGEQSNSLQLYRIDPSTGATTQITQSNDIYKRNPYYSPDGSIVAYTGSIVLPSVAVSAAALHQFAIFTMNPDGSNERALTADPRGTTPSPNDPFLNAYMLGWCAPGPWLDNLWTQAWRNDGHAGGSDAIVVLLHIGATTPAGVAAVILVIFLLIFAMSFAFGPVPEGERHFGRQWMMAWLRASAPRFAIAGAFAGAVLVGALLWGNVGSSSASSCNNSLPPLTGTAITDARILSGIQALSDMTAAAQAGDRDRVRTLFFTEDAHNLSHDIDRPLRSQDSGLAKQLCLSVIAFENQIAGPVDPSAVETQTKAIAADFQQARGILSASSIVTPTVVGTLDPCAQPLQAITNDPLSAQRLQAAIATMQQASQLAASGDEAGAEAAFVGDPHNLTHDIDGPLRGVDRDLALNLCHSIVAIELHLGPKYDPQVMQAEAAKSVGYLQQAGRKLGVLT